MEPTQLISVWEKHRGVKSLVQAQGSVAMVLGSSCTDGTRLSYLGLPIPNLFAGNHNFQSRFEFEQVESEQKTWETMVKILELFASKNTEG